MWLHKIPVCRFFLLRLLIVSLVFSKTLGEIRETKVVFETPDQSVRETTTPVSSSKPIVHDDRNISTTIIENQNDSKIFKPSRHLGEIEQSTSSFNNVHHTRFENNVHLDTSSLLDEATRSSRIKFQDDYTVQTPSIRHSFDDRQTITENPRFAEGYLFVDQTFLRNTERPEVQEIFGKTTTDYRPTGIFYDVFRSPYVVDYYADQNAYQPLSQDTVVETKKPENNGVMIVQQQSTYTRKRKFPYPFYQPGSEYQDMRYMEDPHSTATYSRMKRPFPWKKLIHLIGTFLPLGLLLATLKPNVIRIDNTTQPNIVLSKLRLADLPIEHKQARVLDDQPAGCEDRSICELILASSEPQSNILQNILWNLAVRTADDMAKRNGLREVLNGVRKKNCMAINCLH